MHDGLWEAQNNTLHGNGLSTDLESNPEDWPDVEWPSQPIGKNAPQQGSGNWGTFRMGTGGNCDPSFPGTYDPPFGYYCSNHPPRGTQYRHLPPVSVTAPKGLLPHAPYKNPVGAVIHSWMPEHWYSNAYAIGAVDNMPNGDST